MTAEFGLLRIESPDKIYVVALPTSDPLHFRWRIYLPANYQAEWRSGGGYGRSRSSSPRDFIAQVRLRADDQALSVFAQEDMGSGLSGVANGSFAKHVIDYWEHVEISQAGASGVEAYDADHIINLLELRMNEEMVAAAKQMKLNQYRIPTFFFRRLGTPQAFKAEADRNRASPVGTPQ